ncbi:TIM-barrel domain-containing protein [Bacteroidota bacterium]
MKRKILYLLPVLLITLNSIVFSQNKSRTFINLNDTGNKIEIIVNDGLYQLIPFSNKVVHVTFYPNNKELKSFSYAINQEPEKVEYTINEDENNIDIITSGLRIRIIKQPFQIQYFYGEQKLIEEKQGYFQNLSSLNIDFNITENEILYGGGARVLGMNRRGNKLELYNRAHYGYTTRSELMNFTLPMFISSNQYAVLFDNASKGLLDLDSDSTNTINYETVSGTINYYVIAGANWYDLIEQYTNLTGNQPLPPRWAFGNYSSRFGYHSQEETINTVNKFIEDSIPVDAVIIDIYWFGPGIFNDMGKLDWYRDSFPNPERMIKELEEKGVKTILVTEPFILTTSDRWEEAVNKKVLGLNDSLKPYTYDFYFGNTGLVDVFKPEAREWFWNIYRDLIHQGVAGMWGDLGEPEVHPDDLLHVNGRGDEVHNAYGHKWTQLIYEGYEKDFPDVRPFILMRAGYAGSQRYGIIPWTGDVSRSWGGLVPQPEISLQMGMQGIAYMHSDLGGFAGGDSIDNELYIRWLQYGIFQPIYRPHAQEHIPAEPVFYNDTTKKHARKAIELRYKLLPYIYNMAFENSQTGKPLMIPLFFNEPGNKELLTYDHEYMWGDAFLVSPVTEPGKKYQKIYFPGTGNWSDLYSPKVYKGGTTDSVKLTIDHIPVFVKSGSFVPMLRKAENTSKYNLIDFRLKYFHDKNIANATYELYNDDGKTPGAHEKGKYEKFNFKVDWNGEELVFAQEYTSNKWEGATKSGKIELLIHNLDGKPKKVSVNNIKLKSDDYEWCETCEVLFIYYDWTNAKVEINIVP